MQHQVVLLEERLSTIADMRPHRALALGMSPRVLQETVLGRESLIAVLTEVRLGLGHHVDLLLLLLLLYLLDDLLLLLNTLNLYDGLMLLLLLDMALLLLLYLLLLLLYLMVLHDRRVLWTLLHLHRLAHHLSVGRQDLYWHRIRRDHGGVCRDYGDSWKMTIKGLIKVIKISLGQKILNFQYKILI